MTFEKLGAGFAGNVATPADYHYTAFAGGKLWLFGRKFVDQPSHNWGHRVHFAGSYAVAFDVADKSWGSSIEVPALTPAENVEETLFVSGDAIFLLLHTAFGTPAFLSLYKWSGSEWCKVADLKGAEGGEKGVRLDFVVADCGCNKEKYVIVGGGGYEMKVYKLRLADADSAIEHVIDINEEVNHLRGRPLSGLAAGGQLLISFGVQGCGFRWENKRFIRVDIAAKKAEEVNLDCEDAPPFSFSGTHVTALTKAGEWLHVAGALQVGMCDSKFCPEAWSMTGGPAAPTWKKLPMQVPEEYGGSDFLGAFDPETNTLFLASKESVSATTV